MRQTIITLLFLVATITTNAWGDVAGRVSTTGQSQGDTVRETEHAPSVPPIVPAYDEALDSLIHDFYITRAFKSECPKWNGEVILHCPDSVYIKRLQRLPYEMEMPFNKEVKAFIEMYLRKNRQVSYMAGLGNTYYFKIFEQALMKYNVPMELCYLPVIESALNAHAVSSAGAAGLWQFMVQTGKLYGLEVNSLVDERMDPIKATDAAARYLRDLYKIYGDWHLVIAAYNCGPGNVAKAMRRSGRKTYWGIYNHLPQETRGYVPIFIAANYVMTYYREHNICPTKCIYKYAVDTIMITDRVHLQQIAEVINIPYDELQFLNPQYKKNIIPGDIKAYPLILPMNKITAYTAHRDTILKYKPELVARMTRVHAGSGKAQTTVGGDTESAPSVQGDSTGVETERAPSSQSKSGQSGKVIYYKVRKGDTLSAIARNNRTTVANLQKWNKLKGTNIQIGQTLKIYK